MSWIGLGDGRRASPAEMIALHDRVDSAAVGALRRRVEGALATGRRRVVIDLLGVRYIDTQTLGELCAALRRVSDHGATLAIIAADLRVRWVLELCQIDGLEFLGTITAALARRRVARTEPTRPRWRESIIVWPGTVIRARRDGAGIRARRGGA